MNATHRMFQRILGQQTRLLLILVLGLTLLETIIVLVAAELDVGPGFIALIKSIAPRPLHGLIESQLAFVSFSGLVGFGFQHPAALTMALAFVFVVTTLPAGERESGFLDLILAHPVSRARYLTATLGLLVVGSVVLPSALLLGLGIGLGSVDVDAARPWSSYVPAAAGMTCLLLGTGGYTLWIAVGARRRGPAAARAAGLTIGLYWLDLLADLWAPLTAVRWLTPFAYYRPIQAALDHPVPQQGWLVLLGLFAVSTGLAYRRFQGRDL